MHRSLLRIETEVVKISVKNHSTVSFISILTISQALHKCQLLQIVIVINSPVNSNKYNNQ